MLDPKVKAQTRALRVEPHSSVTVTTNDTVGATFLGVFALLLLIGYLRTQAHARAVEKLLAKPAGYQHT